MRKWNKLLALLLAMVMVFGLAATSFAEGEQEDKDTVASENQEETTEAAEDETDAAEATDAEGEETTEPASEEATDAADAADEGENETDPAETEAPAFDPATVADWEQVGWAKDNVAVVLEKGLVDLDEDNNFKPLENMTRADVVLALYRLADKPAVDVEVPFTDIAELGEEAQAAIAWAYSKEIVNGDTETTFDPNGTIQRQQIAKILFIYAGDKAAVVEEDHLAAFPDKDNVQAYAVDYLNWLVSTGLMNGSDGNLLPRDPISRREVATLLVRYIDILTAEATEPAEGDENATEPAEGDENATEPAEGDENATEPAEGDENATEPAEGDENATEPAEGDEAEGEQE